MWILILVAYLNNTSVALNHIPNFKTEQECKVAGDKYKTMSGTPNYGYICVQQ